LGCRYAGIFADAWMHTPVEVIEAALALVESQDIGGLVALGGGSTGANQTPPPSALLNSLTVIDDGIWICASAEPNLGLRTGPKTDLTGMRLNFQKGTLPNRNSAHA
jgi:hypothetical protein